MKLKTHLRECNLDQLRAIADWWGLQLEAGEPALDAAGLAEYLYPRMQVASNFRNAFDQLTPAQRDWVYFLAIHGGELPIEEFRKRCRFETADAMNEALAPLFERGFLWRERLRDKLISHDLIGIPEPFVRLVDLPPYWQGFLGYYLQALGTDDLRAITKHTLETSAPTRRKQALVHFLRKRLLEPKSLQQVLARLNPLQVEMFKQILQKNGVCAWKDLLDAGVHKKFDHQRADKLRELVEQSGLVFVLRSAPNKYNNLLLVPRDVAWVIQNGYKRDERSLEELSHSGPEATTRKGADGGMRPGVILDNSNNILRDLVILCAYIQRNPVKMLNNGSLGRNDLKKIVPLMSHNKTIKYVSFLALFAIVRKLIIAVGDQWRVSSSLGRWLEGGQACYRDLYQFWLNTSEWNEEFIDGDVVHADNYPQNLISIIELRKLVLRMLEKLPSETWIDFETFAESLLPQIAIEIPGRFDLTPADKHNRHPTLIMESVVAETLYWLGLVVLGVSDLEVARQLGSRPNEAIAPYDPSRPFSSRLVGDEQLMFMFRLSETGAEILTRTYLDPEKLFARMPDGALPFASQSTYFTVQPNQEIVTPPDLQLDKFFTLLQFADIKKVDVMTTLTISHDSIRAGLDSGLTARQMLALLQECSRKDVPETVRQMISECESRHGELDMGMAGGYLRVADRHHLEELRANSKIAPYIKDVFDDRLVLLSRTTDFRKLTRELQRLGYLPRVDSDSLYVTNEGLFQITLREEELYDLLAILQFGILLEEEKEASIFEDRIQPLFQRLSGHAQENFNPKFYAESIARNFIANYEKANKKTIDEETRKYRKQLNRLLTQMPKARALSGYKGENPAREPAEIGKLVRYAIEHEKPVRILYERTTGEQHELTIEPEALQGKKVYAYCPDQDEHHIYSLERVQQASI